MLRAQRTPEQKAQTIQRKTPLPNTPEFPQDTRRKKKPQPAGSLPEGSAAIHSILTSVVASVDGIPGEINVKI